MSSPTERRSLTLPSRPAATVMLVRDSAGGIAVFLMRRHSADGIRGRGDGVSRRWRRRPRPQRRDRLGRAAAVVVGATVRHRNRTGRGAGLRRRPGDLRGMWRAVRRPGRRSGRASSATRRCTANPGWRWPTGRCRSPTSCAGKTWCCGPTCCGRGRTGSPRKPNAPAATTRTSSSECCRRASVPTARTPNPTVRDGRRRRRPSTTSQPAARFLLPPTWTQLDSLAGRTRRRRVGRRAADRPRAAASGDQRRQLDFRVLRLRPLPPGAQSGRTGMAAVSEFVSINRGSHDARAWEPWCSRGRPPTP